MRVTVTLLLVLLPCGFAQAQSRSWASDNENGTYSNPLFYDEFSDPDMIRVGEDFYLTGTTMHAMPGLPVLHSRDLVNWRFLSYAFQRLDLGPEFRLEGGQEAYGQGIWAPSFRHHKGTFYIFANVNRHGVQVFRATDPRGPWKHNRIPESLHDLSVLFDDDGKIYAVYGARVIRIVELNGDLTAVVPGTDRVVLDRDRGMGEGSHFYKIQGRYYIVSAIPGAHTPMVCARAGRIEGPWEITTISEKESLGVGLGYRLKDGRRTQPPFEITPPNPAPQFGLTLHQGGIIDTPWGEWWGYSMQDHNSVGRLTCLSPVTWRDGWPYFGLPGNLTRTPSTWVKPAMGAPITAPYDRSDDFGGPLLQPVWQWNHLPEDTKWSLLERPGHLRLYSLPAPDFWRARNSLTQRAIGPESEATAELDGAGMKAGDVAGLALLNVPYTWIGMSRLTDGFAIEHYDQTTDKRVRLRLSGPRVWLRAHCNFDTEKAQMSYSSDGKVFQPLGEEFTMVFQLKTFQGVRYALFHYNTGGAPGGHADFDRFDVVEPRPRGLTQPIPYGRQIVLSSLGNGRQLAVGDGLWFRVVDRGQGRVALRAHTGEHVSVAEDGASVRLKKGSAGNAETFQWVDLQRGHVMLLSLATDRYLVVPVGGTDARADHPGPSPDRRDGSCFRWETR